MTRKTVSQTASPGTAAFLAEARPGDALEAMLVAQMAAVHEAAMRCLARAAEVSADHPQIEALYLRQAARLLHLFQRQAEALDRRRIAAEDRAEDRARTERLEERSWQQESAHARRCGEPAPPPPPCRGAAWPAWPARAQGADAREPRGPSGSGRRNGAAPPG